MMSWKRRLGLMLLIALVAAAFWLLETDRPAAEIDAKYSNAESEFLVLPDQTRVHYRDQGQADGLPVVLIHGSNASLHTWELWVRELAPHYRMVTVDMPGHGLTGRTPADDYSSAAFVATLKSLVQHLNLPPFVLGGNSMGGGVSWRYALSHPDDVRGLLLLNASGPRAWRRQPPAVTPAIDSAAASAQPASDPPLAFSLLRQPWFAAIGRYVDPYYLTVQGLRSAHYDTSLVTEALISRYYDLSLRAGTRAATLRRFGTDRPDAPVDLQALQLPVLVQWGKYDAVIPAVVGQRFKDALPDAQLIVYDNVGHIPMEEIPRRSAADAHAFIQARIAGTALENRDE